MILEKSFGEKINGVNYKDRVGAYAILVDNNKVALIKTQKGYFLPGGGLEIDETFEDCIKRECVEEIGMSVIVKDFICKGDKYSWIDNIGYFHSVGYFYLAQKIELISEPTEKDHELVWIDSKDCCNCLHLEHQAWAVNQAIKRKTDNDLERIEDITSSLKSRHVLSILAQSIYMPSEDKLNTLINSYLKNQDIVVYGYIEDNEVEGIIVLDTSDINNIIILNIAVTKLKHLNGIGRKLIEYAIMSLKPNTLIAETDDDAVVFYKKCGFEIRSLGEKYEHTNRYECIFRNKLDKSV